MALVVPSAGVTPVTLRTSYVTTTRLALGADLKGELAGIAAVVARMPMLMIWLKSLKSSLLWSQC